MIEHNATGDNPDAGNRRIDLDRDFEAYNIAGDDAERADAVLKEAIQVIDRYESELDRQILDSYETTEPRQFEFSDYRKGLNISETGAMLCPLCSGRAIEIDVAHFIGCIQENRLLEKYYCCSNQHIFRIWFKGRGNGIMTRVQMQVIVDETAGA